MQEQNLPTPVNSEVSSTPVPEVKPVTTGKERNPMINATPELARPPMDTVNQGAPTTQYKSVDLPQPIQQQPADQQRDSGSIMSAPSVADDVDVIEKAWVEKAKSIVKQTKDDPYTQEKHVSSLQEDYQRKRYGKERK